MQNLKRLMGLVLLAIMVNVGYAQPGTNVNIDKEKPKQYEQRKLPSEKTGEKKFTLIKRGMNNMYTHYNYYFNANNKLNEVLEKTKLAFKDDFTKLLPFYNYTLDGTAQNKGDLDSIIYKCTAGILLHDLRSDWVDNMYMLMGRAYLFRKDYDSAAGCFQYINYTYAPKEEGGYDILLGSNTSNTGGKFTISTNEKKRSFLRKMTSRPPSRNESFIWQARNYLEQDQTGEAAGLLGILRSDPFFPKRLQTDLHEMVAYMFYKMENYDSAAYHLQKSLDNAEGRNDQARWEFLIGQMYQATKKDSMAIRMYERSIKHSLDPLMEIYARLNVVTLASSSKKDALQDNLDELIKLAKREKYEEYRDIIYYAAALLELKRNSYDAAQDNLLKSVKYSIDNPTQKNKSFLLLADMNYGRNRFIAAHNFYDSVQSGDALKNAGFSKDDKDRVESRKPSLKIIAKNIETVNREDSLQRVALMPEAERTLYIKKLLKKLRKERGLKESDEGSYNTQASTSKDANLFGEDGKGDFYFGNSSAKSKGFSEFKVKWGKRANVDNWRRQSAVDKAIAVKTKNDGATPDVDDAGPAAGSKLRTKTAGDDQQEKESDDISFEGLMSKLPLTEERLAASNRKILNALVENGETFQNRLENYPAAVETYDDLFRRFGSTMFPQKEEALFNLYYCYNKLGLTAKADSVKALMTAVFSDGNFTNKLREGNNTDTKKKDAAVTKKYEAIYALFVEGNFEQAKNEKAKADAQYGKNYWTPQLMYIEAIYYVKQRNDDSAISKLQSLVTMFPKSELAPKATNMINVLRKRTEIETYLTNLKVERKQDTIAVVDTTSTYVPPVVAKPAAKKDKFDFVATDTQYVVVILDKVDRVFVNETKNSFGQYNSRRFRGTSIPGQIVALNDQYNLLLLGPFEDGTKALDYLDKTRPEAPTAILSWLPANKYSFSLISPSNLTLLLETKDIAKYQQILKQAVPGKF